MTNAHREEIRQADLDALQMDSFAATAYCGRQWTKSSTGMPEGGRSGDTAFGILAVETPSELTVVEDTTLDPRFAATALVEGGLRFYSRFREDLCLEAAPGDSSGRSAGHTVPRISRRQLRLLPAQA